MRQNFSCNPIGHLNYFRTERAALKFPLFWHELDSRQSIQKMPVGKTTEEQTGPKLGNRHPQGLRTRGNQSTVESLRQGVPTTIKL